MFAMEEVVHQHLFWSLCEPFMFEMAVASVWLRMDMSMGLLPESESVVITVDCCAKFPLLFHLCFLPNKTGFVLIFRKIIILHCCARFLPYARIQVP